MSIGLLTPPAGLEPFMLALGNPGGLSCNEIAKAHPCLLYSFKGVEGVSEKGDSRIHGRYSEIKGGLCIEDAGGICFPYGRCVRQRDGLGEALMGHGHM
jgi:hypothetical protein